MTTAPAAPAVATPDDSDELMNPPAPINRPKAYFGEITILNIWDCVLRKGSRPLPFDPGQHRPDEKLISVSVTIQCERQDSTFYTLEQSDINTGSKWRTTAESLRKLNYQRRAELENIVGKFVQVVRVPTGRKYEATKDAADGSFKKGDKVDETALSFVAVYESAEACKAAELAFYAPRSESNTQPSASPVSAAALVGSTDGKAKAMLLGSLPFLWQNAKGDYEAFGRQLTASPQFAQYGITLASPEVIAVTGQIPF